MFVLKNKSVYHWLIVAACSGLAMAAIGISINYAVENASLKIDAENKLCVFSVTIDTNICPVMEYFEIFLDRMVLCRKAADFLGLTFELIINETRLL